MSTVFETLKTKKARIEHLRKMLGTDIRWATRALLRIYENQTADEQAAGFTRNYNGVGFTGVDGEIMSSFAEQVKRGRTLSQKQVAILFKKMPKYAKQLESVAKKQQKPADRTEEFRVPGVTEPR